jgi:hypothetical protein
MQIKRAWKMVRHELDVAIGDLKAEGLYEVRGSKRTADGVEKGRGLASFLAEEQEVARGSAAAIADVVQNINNPDAGTVLEVGVTEHLNNLREVKQELTAYLMIEALDLDADPLQWWALYRNQFPGLARVAMYYLCIPASSAAVERFFSGMGLTVSALRSCLSSESLEQLVYLRLNWEELLYHVDYQGPRTQAEAQQEAEEADSEGEDDYVGEEEQEEEADPVPDFDQLAAELATTDQGVGPLDITLW